MTLKNKKHGTIALAGAPNAGKSTLTNALLGQKLTIVSPKAQTTRNSIKAIVIEEETQLIILDTPGIFIPRDDKILERIIVKSAWQALRDANHVCFLVDATVGMSKENIRILEDL
ncbi:MAG: GTP-binding protein, partial [Pelagibacterales bacterium]|nr:GTP-binding protein [Pelagibacterales bacterium]